MQNKIRDGKGDGKMKKFKEMQQKRKSFTKSNKDQEREKYIKVSVFVQPTTMESYDTFTDFVKPVCICKSLSKFIISREVTYGSNTCLRQIPGWFEKEMV